ncbi:MAG: energy transducer TonB [Thiobacillus sp.]
MTVPISAGSLDEPSIPPRLQRPLAALWISLGLHAALIALVQVAPPASPGGGHTIEARLVDAQSAPAPLAPSEAGPALPAPPAEPAVPPVSATALPTPAAEPRPPEPAAGGALHSAVDLTFYTARELDVQPRALGSIEPDYPLDADRQRRSGKVRLQLKLEADGRVSDVEIVQADPPGVFDESAVRAFRAARFSPAQKNGRAVRALLLIEVEYDWPGGDAAPPGHGD